MPQINLVILDEIVFFELSRTANKIIRIKTTFNAANLYPENKLVINDVTAGVSGHFIKKSLNPDAGIS